MRNTYQFTPRFFVRAVAQFDSSQKRVLGDFLASYELSPRNRRARRVRVAVRTRAGRRHSDGQLHGRRRARSLSRLPTAPASNRRNQPSGARAVAAVRVEQRRMIERAQPADDESARPEPRRARVDPGSPPEIEMRLRLCREPAVGVRMCREMRRSSAHLIAARADARTNGGDQIARSRAVSRRQSAATAAIDRTSGGALPSRVNGRDGSGRGSPSSTARNPPP